MKLEKLNIQPLIGGGVSVTCNSRYLEGDYPDVKSIMIKKLDYDYRVMRISLAFCLVTAKRLYLNGYVKALGIMQALAGCNDIENSLPLSVPQLSRLQPKLEHILFILPRFANVKAPPSYEIAGHLELVQDFYDTYLKKHEAFNNPELAR